MQEIEDEAGDLIADMDPTLDREVPHFPLPPVTTNHPTPSDVISAAKATLIKNTKETRADWFLSIFNLFQLETKQLDLYLIHMPTVIENGDFEGTWREFERFKQEGLTKYVF